MRTVPRSRFDHIRKAHPAAVMEFRDGAECIVIPTYDIDTDTAGEIILKVVEDRDRKPQPGDILTDPNTGATFKIVDPASLIPVRKGPIADEF